MTEMRGFCRGFDSVTILVCIRNQIDFAQSVYAQISRKINPPDPASLIADLVETGMIVGLEADYRLLLDRIGVAFAPHEIRVLNYETCASREVGVVGALLQEIGASASGLKSVPRANVSEPHVAVWAANAVWPTPERPPECVTAAAAKAYRETYGPHCKASVFTREEAERLKAHFDPINAELEARIARTQPEFRFPPLQVSRDTIYREMLSQEFWDRFAILRESALAKRPTNP